MAAEGGERETVLLRRKRDEMETALPPLLLLLMGKYNCWGKELHPRHARGEGNKPVLK